MFYLISQSGTKRTGKYSAFSYPVAQFEPKSVAQITPKSVAQNEPE